MCLCLTRLFLMLHKELIVCIRRPSALIFTVLLPFLVLLLYFTFTAAPVMRSLTDPNSTTPRIFKKFSVSGNRDDFQRQIDVNIRTIEDTYCASSKTLEVGIVFKEGDSSYTSKFMELLRERYWNVTFHSHPTEEDLVDALEWDTDLSCDNAHFMGGVVFKKFRPEAGQLRYAILLTSGEAYKKHWYTGKSKWRSFIVMNAHMKNPFASSPDEPNFWSSGFLSLQLAIDIVFTQIAPNSKGKLGNYSISLERVPEPSHCSTGFYDILGIMSVIMEVASFFIVIESAQRISVEKDSGMTAFLSLMGMSSFTFYLAHVIVVLLKLTVGIFPSCLLIAGYLKDYVDPSIFLTTCLLYFVCLACYSLLMSSVLHTPSLSPFVSALIFSVMVYIGSYDDLLWTAIGAPNIFVFETILSLNVVYVFHHSLLAFRVGLLRDKYFGWANCFDLSMGTYRVGVALGLMVLHCIFAVLLTAYLDRVFPFGDLPRRHPLFFLGVKENPEVEDQEDVPRTTTVSRHRNENIQLNAAVNPEEIDISVEHLVKKYGGHRAVDDITFRGCRGKVTALVGHNGAGKSTTFGLISGLGTPSSGSIRVCGVTLLPSSVRLCQRNIGYCPQYNPLFEALTIRDHLKLFRAFCGNPDANAVENVLKWLDLADVADVSAKKLSYGSRRRLALGIAIVSGRKVLLLDEPTAGLDPVMRRRVNSVIEQLKPNRTILLTTQTMSEVDLLGDYVVMLVRGGIACAGTPEFLRKRYSTGYKLCFSFKEGSSYNTHEVMKIVRQHVKEAVIMPSPSRQFAALLPAAKKGSFADLLASIEASSEKRGVDSFGLSVNSVEQIFFKAGLHAGSISDTRISDVCYLTETPLAEAMWFDQLFVLIRKRALAVSKKYSILVMQLVLTLLLMFAAAAETVPTFLSTEVLMDVDTLSPSLVLMQSTGQLSPFYSQLQQTAEKAGDYSVKKLEATDDIHSVILDLPRIVLPHSLGFVVKTSQGVTAVNALFHARARHGPIIAITFITNAVLGYRSDSVASSLQPYYGDSTPESEQSEYNAFSFTVLNALSFSVIFASFIMPAVEEEKFQFIHMQFGTGVNPVLYWLSMLIFDFVVYFLCCVLYLLIFVWTGGLAGRREALWVLWILSFFSAAPFLYCLTVLFFEASAAAIVIIVSYVLCSFVGLTVELIIKKSPVIGYILHFPLMLFPGYALDDGSRRILLAEKVFAFNGVTRSLIMMVLSGCISAFCIYVRHSLNARTWLYFKMRDLRIALLKKIVNVKEEAAAVVEDEDVREDRKAVGEHAASDFVMCVRDLNKYFGEKHAVRNLTIGVPQKECFGLLGVHGAGKTSTFLMLTGITIPDSGNISFFEKTRFDRQPVGFCPDCLAVLDDLSAREVLTLIASLRGFDNAIDRVRIAIESVSLTAYSRQPVRELSFGQRRRLSVAIALMYGSPLMIFDDPTMGVDPRARRDVWQLLNAVRDKQVTILLSSPSMLESEALCTRIGFMHSGSLIAIGSAQHIRSKYGKGYTLTVKINDLSKRENIVKTVEKEFPQAKLKTTYPSVQIEWEFEETHENRLSKLYAAAHKLFSETPEVVDYTVAQSSLDAAYLKLSGCADHVVL